MFRLQVPLNILILLIQITYIIARPHLKLKELSMEIDLTNKWKAKHLETKSGSTRLNSSAIVNENATSISASSGGYKGYTQKGYLAAKGQAKASVNMKLDKKSGVSVGVGLPSGSAHAGPVGISTDLSTNLIGKLTNNGTGLHVGIDGPSVGVKLGPVSVGISPGLGVKVYGDKQKAIGAIVDTPVGGFGFKAGCVTEICIAACVSVKVCNDSPNGSSSSNHAYKSITKKVERIAYTIFIFVIFVY